MEQHIQHAVTMLKWYSSPGLAYRTCSFEDHKRDEHTDKLVILTAITTRPITGQ